MAMGSCNRSALILDSNTISYYFRGDQYYAVRDNEVVVIVVAVGSRERSAIYNVAAQR